ncbi:Probable leucine-rich repeat receptor-like protein kinase [Striga hermonthica]|uniref:Probable leucine-rich repeat receptor-like protein kinase n=1 Tax=Striga hermonthica TaxID=68872 RepID=A0A9N7N278_STRHE|nr:Probable leucine-rich repeat receptor-like protein kinase [Striga hermonthica]
MSAAGKPKSNPFTTAVSLLLLLLNCAAALTNPDTQALLHLKSSADPNEENGFSGSISGLTSLTLQDFNVSGNHLAGEIPIPLSGFPAESFLGNRALCGTPLEKCKVVSSDPTRPGGAMASPVSPKTTVASSPTTMPSEMKPLSKRTAAARRKISWPAIIGIILGDVVVLGLLSLLIYCYFWSNYSKKLVSGKSRGAHVEKIVYSSSPYPNPAHSGHKRGKMVFFNGEKRFELEDLLRASAEMLGKGGYGTVYKAVLDDGSVVAVKRLKDMTVNGRKEFEQQMEFLGRLRHPNLVGLKAYYFARDEKLLVYDYMPNGNLFWLLHGNRGPGRTPLDWTARLNIASGAARGLAFIHSSGKPIRPVHGNIKSTNVLIDKEGNPKLSDFGLSIFASISSAPKSNGYGAPESPLDGRKQTQKSDVYSFGVLLLELLTGKSPYVMDGNGPGHGGPVVVDLPRWVRSVVREEWTSEVFDLELVMCKGIDEELVGLLQVALACAEASPDRRPRMDRVVRMIEDVRGAEVSPLQETVGPGSGSPVGSEGEGVDS